MNNKPVAWWTGKFDDESEDFIFPDTRQKFIDHPIAKNHLLFPIPLYTHPAKDKPHPKCDEACMYLCRMRELTDEEIMEIVADKYEKGHGRYIDTKLFFVEFAKAILRKAQEK